MDEMGGRGGMVAGKAQRWASAGFIWVMMNGISLFREEG